jgi:signal transduction histidine kinase
MLTRVLGSLSGVRVRVTAVAVLAVAVALAVSAAVVDISLEHDRHSVLLNTAQVEARQVELLNDTLTYPVEVPPCSNMESGLVQVLHNNRIVGVCRGLRGSPPLWVAGEPIIQSFSDPALGPARDVHVVALPVTVANKDRGTVAVVVSLDQYDRSLGSVHRLLEAGLPILLLVVGLICWLIVGRALRKIESLRQQVAEIAATPGEHRVADPRTNDEVGRLARTLNSMLDRLEQSSTRERRFVADASHELRSPIANIRTALEVALHRPESADWERVADDVLDEDARMGSLVEQLLLLGQSDEGRLTPAGSTSDLLAVARTAVASYGVLEPGPVITVSGQSVAVHVPEAYLERVVVNLVDNARRHATSRVDVSVGRIRHRARLIICDDGPGVPIEDRARIFERFVRLDEARDREQGGFGLGLAIVTDLCRAYEGTIAVSDGGPGAVFCVEFPVATPSLVAPLYDTR